jgi:hypothetical protein
MTAECQLSLVLGCLKWTSTPVLTHFASCTAISSLLRLGSTACSAVSYMACSTVQRLLIIVVGNQVQRAVNVAPWGHGLKHDDDQAKS